MEKSKHKSHGGKSQKKNGKNDPYKQEDEAETTCCFCVKTKKSKKKGLIAGCVTNLGIFALLLAYTLLGAFIFLAIEGGAAKMHQKTLATTSYQTKQKNPATKSNGTIAQASAELRSQTVENIWEITVSLNILYKENWTRLAAQEIARFQEQLVARVAADLAAQYGAGGVPGGPRALQAAVGLDPLGPGEDYEWTFAKAFLYSLTVLTTIGYGSVAPRTALGKAVTIGYAVLGIPLTLLYLSVVGALLSRLARGVCSRALCCCLCTKCGYCCLDERSLPDDEHKDKRRDDLRGPSLPLQEPYYVRSPSGTIISAAQAHRAGSVSVKDKTTPSFGFLRECDSLSCADTESRASLRGLSILAPVLLCLCAIFAYILFGAVVLFHLEDWSLIDGVYFCFMSLSTIGFGHLTPGATGQRRGAHTATVWFCSVYIVSGLALTAMCFNVLHDEIVHRLRHHERAMRAQAHRALAPDYLHTS